MPKDKIAPSEGEIDEVLNWCWEAEERGRSHFRGMTYEQGVRAGIEWATGRSNERPDQD